MSTPPTEIGFKKIALMFCIAASTRFDRRTASPVQIIKVAL